MKKSVLNLTADKTVSRIAFKDMTKYLLSGNFGINIRDGHGDIWIVTPEWLLNKETRRLNEELGLHRINKFHKNEISSFDKLKDTKICVEK